jgi:hypothetical protein
MSWLIGGGVEEFREVLGAGASATNKVVDLGGAAEAVGRSSPLSRAAADSPSRGVRGIPASARTRPAGPATSGRQGAREAVDEQHPSALTGRAAYQARAEVSGSQPSE